GGGGSPPRGGSGPPISGDWRSGRRQPAILRGLDVGGSEAGAQAFLGEERLEARDVALLVGGHLRGEGAHRVGARIRGDVVVERLRAPFERERDGERIGGGGRRRRGAHRPAARKTPARPP